MDSNKKKILIISSILAIIIILIIWYIKSKKEGADAENKINSAIGDASTVVDSFPLKKGSKGKESEQLQIFLLRNFGAQFPKFGIDGEIGDETIGNMKKFLNTESISKSTFLKNGMDQLKTAKYK